MKGLPKEALDKPIPVGRKDSPYGFIKRSDIKDYLNDEFFKSYKIWKMYHMNLGLPGSRSWDNQPMHIIHIIETIQDEYTWIAK